MAINTAFATIQLLLALGIAWRPTVRVALGASIVWALGVWWFGEGLGGVLTGTASPVSGAPGPVILYALLAILLWPRARGASTPGSAGPAVPCVAARAVGAPAARALWLVLWASLAYFALLPANRAPQGLHAMLSGMTEVSPLLASIGQHGAAGPGPPRAGRLGRAGRPPVLIAIGVYLPPLAARTILALAMVVSRRDLGGRPGPRWHPHRHRDRPQFWPVADLAGARLLAHAGTDGARTDETRADGARAVHGPAAGRAMTPAALLARGHPWPRSCSRRPHIAPPG